MNSYVDVGLVLEGGGFRGIYTAAVLDAFLKENLFFNYVIGVSAGAAYGVSYVSRQLERNLQVNEYVSDKRYCSFRNLIKTGNYFNWDFIYKEIPMKIIPFDYEGFSSSTSRMQVVLTNCTTGKAEYKVLNNTSPDRFRDLLTATSSLPFISKIKEIDDQYYMDGGIADSIPVDKAFADGNERLIVVLTRDSTYRKEKMKGEYMLKLMYGKYPNMVRKFAERADSYNHTLEKLAFLEETGKVFVIRPTAPIPVSRMENDPELLKRVYHSTIREMNDTIPALRKWLSKPR